MNKLRTDPEYEHIKYCTETLSEQESENFIYHVVKMLDLWAFGNSVIEIMVGKCQEVILNANTKEEKKR